MAKRLIGGRRADSQTVWAHGHSRMDRWSVTTPPSPPYHLCPLYNIPHRPLSFLVQRWMNDQLAGGVPSPKPFGMIVDHSRIGQIIFNF